MLKQAHDINLAVNLLNDIKYYNIVTRILGKNSVACVNMKSMNKL